MAMTHVSNASFRFPSELSFVRPVFKKYLCLYREQQEKEVAEKEGCPLNQEDHDELDLKINPFKPITEVISVVGI